MRHLPRLRFSIFLVLRSVIAVWLTLRRQHSNGSHPLDRARNRVGFGPTIEELVDLLTPLVRHPRALGLEPTIYDPGLDPDRSCATRLVSLLENVLLGVRLLDGRAA
jgi:hypothetical protein